MQNFFINQNSVLPRLIVNLVHDGRFSFGNIPYYECIQEADVTFTMVNEDNGFVKVSDAPCRLKLLDGGCTEKYAIVYDWKPMDTNEKGRFKGTFEITFPGKLRNEDGTEYPAGNLIAPIIEPIIVTIL